METFIKPKQLVSNPGFERQKRKTLADLTDGMIDPPLVDIINGFNNLPYCFTLQCCYGHFVYDGHWDPHNLDPLPESAQISSVEYRIAYIAYCIDNGEAGRELLDKLQKITAIDPENIQFCSARWFWRRQVNSYALQVEPDRFKHQDKAVLDYKEALYIENLRNEFFLKLERLLQDQRRL
ncbi:MAG: hypothetical protein AMS23_07585 [Bacteroides sp. SM1_62]|nr:MAG: hypothetical protein AMS26_11860 [Bacteroides sp. SM23_62]KPL22652.1 MAG: hypothetical protein AMS23_07585 [Bacteroides sp. SM1_62]